jgi:hypothetical protein
MMESASSMTVPIFAEGEKIRIAVILLSSNTFLSYIEIGTLKRQAVTGKPACFGQAVSSKLMSGQHLMVVMVFIVDKGNILY